MDQAHKKPTRQHQRQRQKLKRKTIILICAASVCCMMIGLTVFFHLSNVNRINAANNNVIMVPDQAFTTEKSIAEPEIVSQPKVNSNTVFARQAKALPLPAKPINH